MKITGIETFVVDTGFTPRRPWLFSAVRTDAGLTALEPFNLFWLEIDNQDAAALAELRRAVRVPICSGEQLLTVRQYRPYFDHQAMDVVMVDACGQGFAAARKVADLAEACELNIAPNYNGHLSTFQATGT